MDIGASLWVASRDFFERGGVVLLVLGLIMLVMWTLILNRWIYLRKEYRADISSIILHWIRWQEQDSAVWARLKADAFDSVAFRLKKGLSLIRALAGVCPLLGLLGTVIGMITIFQVMGSAGAGSPRVVAAGVSTAMVTTMAGMVGALSGIFPAIMLARRARAHVHELQKAGGEPDGFAGYAERKRSMRLKRIVAAPIGGFLITMALVMGMEEMIQIGRIALADGARMVPVDFVRVERNETVERREKPEKPRDPEMQPEMPQQVSIALDTAVRIVAVAPPVTMSSVGGIGGLGFVAADGEYLPIVKVAPIYPPRAAAQGLEGYVILQYTVTATGDTRDIVVLESSSSLFELAAIDSARKYKFKPRIIDGTPIDVAGVTTRVIFELED